MFNNNCNLFVSKERDKERERECVSNHFEETRKSI